ncbi:uncharacterized protein [Littorina saxatilis]|uniref:uncharacterized protein isoform X2 n=1 Tax=Littorina saxatilis TaxID=31220 RepID=UPI0038B65BAD
MAACFLLSRQSTCALGLLRTSPSASALKLPSALRASASNFHFQFHEPHRDLSSIRPSKPLAVTQLVRSLTTKKESQENLEKKDKGNVDAVPDRDHLEHFKDRAKKKEDSDSVKTSSLQETHLAEENYTLPHPIWSEDQLHDVKITHTPPECFVDKLALFSVKMLRGGFDILSGFKVGQRNEHKWLKRIIFLETVAGVPGMVAAMMRHMLSLRRLQRDHGWIHTLLEEAENERMHLMTALQLKKPSWIFKTSVIGSQGVFVTLFGACYIISPKFCHRFVGYLEEEAVITYTKCLEDINGGPMKHWQTQKAPEIAVNYWRLTEDATMRDVILAIRADEAHHRLVNHTLASLKPNQLNPYKPGK